MTKVSTSFELTREDDEERSRDEKMGSVEKRTHNRGKGELSAREKVAQVTAIKVQGEGKHSG